MKQILVINPGSTSTKIAWYCDEEKKWDESIDHDPAEIKKYAKIYDQLEMRTQLVMDTVKAHGEKFEDLAGVVSRGGLLPPAKEGEMVCSGAYEINPLMIETLKTRPVLEHASNVGCAIAYQIAQSVGVKCWIYDPVTVDELIEISRVTGLKDIRRHGQGHNLNMRAAALRLCKEKGYDYYKRNIIVAHLGGGVTESLHSNGRIIDMVSDDDGAFSPERAGEIPTYLLLKKVFNEGLDLATIMKTLQRNGGLQSYFGTSDSRVVEKMMNDGNEEAKLVYDAMALGVARCIAKLAVAVNGKVDDIVLTGGIAYSKYFTQQIIDRVGFIAPVTVLPGENEMQALAQGALRVLNGEETARVYGE